MSGRWHGRRWPQILISIALIAWMLSAVDFDISRWHDSAARVRWWPIVLALLLRPVAVAARAWQATLILGSAGTGLSLRDVWRAFMFGEMLSRFVPGNLGTVAYVAKLSSRLGEAFIAQLLDRVLFLALTLLVAAPSLAWTGHGFLALLSGAALIALSVLAYVSYHGLVRWVPLSASHRGTIERVLASREDWGRSYLLASGSSLALMTALFGLLVMACGGRIDVIESAAAVTLVTIGTALPFTVNGIGVREWVFVALLKDDLPTEESVVTLAATTYLVGLVSALVGVLTWALMSRKGTAAGAEG
jgi:uncharacterized membrane protein YbhN (UPF0104 family)